MAGEGGKLGCQVWFRSELARGVRCAVQAVSPRLAVLWRSRAAMRQCIASCHAPHNVAPDGERR
eukprot:6745302-Lingulodinium_polyedra.AAC.1